MKWLTTQVRLAHDLSLQPARKSPIDGHRQPPAIFIDKGQGRLEPREVKLGHRGAGYVEVRQGVAEGEAVVESANFLIDAESNLKAALNGFQRGAPQ